MTEIVPRWEWRWFGRRFGPAESRLAGLTPGAVQAGDVVLVSHRPASAPTVADSFRDEMGLAPQDPA